MLNASIATSEKRKNRDGDYEEQTEFHRIVVWGKKAEIIHQYFNKGDGIMVEGKIQTRKWEDKQGNTRYTTEVNVWNFEFPPGKSAKNQGKSGGGYNNAPGPDGDIPF